jgi:1,4-dihydroxy-2-naphthoate octaprenyltransferase
MDAFEILVVILATILGVILLCVLVVLVVAIKVIKDIRHITHKASAAADNIGQAAQFFRSTSSVAAVTKIVGNAVEAFASSRKKSNK